MTSAFSKLIVHTDQHPGQGIEIRSPVSGLISQVEHNAGPAFTSGLLADSVQVQLQGHQLIAPFAGTVSSMDYGGHRITLHHAQGLQLDIVFPAACIQQTLGFRWLVPLRSKIAAGQPILQFDMARLSRWSQPLCLYLSIAEHPKIQRLHSKSGYVAAGADPLFWLELKTTTAG